MNNFSNIKTIASLALVLLCGVGIGYYLLPKSSVDHTGHDHTQSVTETGDVVWTCSMHPQIKMNEPGKCALCGMDLIPLDESSSGGHPHAVQLSDNAIKLASISTMIASVGNQSKKVRLNGKIALDERKIYTQPTHIPGRIEQLAVNFTGEKVQKGQLLATIYSPELLSAQQELLYAASKQATQPEMFAAAKEKLKNWKLSDRQITQIINAGKPTEVFAIYADVGGIVTKKNVARGDYMMQGASLYEIADLQHLWFLFDIYENDMSLISIGDSVKIQVGALPEKRFNGKVVFIDPSINPTTRVATARVEVENADGSLKPEMFATGEIIGKSNNGGTSIVLPKSAIMWTGQRSIVYVKDAEANTRNLFQMREVTLGASVGDGYVIADGLADGEEVVVNGTFTVDAAAQLAGKPSMMNPSEAMQVSTTVDLSASEINALQNVFDAYFSLKDALAFDKLAEATAAHLKLNETINQTSVAEFSPELNEIWENTLANLPKIEKKNLTAEKITELRKVFLSISTQMVKLATSVKKLDNIIYVQHCPMANNNGGADWLSLSKEIENPYYGASMFGCGEVTMTIK